MTDLEKAQEYEAKAKAIRREIASKKKWANENKEALLKEWGVSDILGELAELYETDKVTLLAHLKDENQVAYFKRKHKTEEETETYEAEATFDYAEDAYVSEGVEGA